MELQKGESNVDCILAAAAMVMDIPIKDLRNKIGHDGGEKIFDAPEPYCFRGFHMQEIIDQAFLNSWSVMNVQSEPGLAPYTGTGDPFMLTFNDNRIKTYLSRFSGIIAGVQMGSTHAVAWDGKRIYDPGGRIYKLSEFEYIIKELWLFSKIDWNIKTGR